MIETQRARPTRVVGLIGPTNLERISQASGIPEKVYADVAFAAGSAIARSGAAMAIFPDRGVAMSGAMGYRHASGAWMMGLVPQGGPSDAVATPNCLENAGDCDEVRGGFTWHHQHALICELCDALVCVGISCGTIAEIAWTKWVKGPRVYVFRETISAIPPEILAETQVVFIDGIRELERYLASR